MKHHLHTFLCAMAFICLQSHAAPTYEYRLTDSNGNTVTQQDFPNQYQLIAFGFTHCPDVCPTTLYDFKQILANITQPERLQAIFITIDPQRDTPELLSKYTSYFDKRILALTGKREAIDQAVENFNASYGYQLEGKTIDAQHLPTDKPYLVFHSTLIYLLDKQGKLLDVFDYQIGHKRLLSAIEASITASEK